MQSTTSIRLFRVSDAVTSRVRRSGRAALSLVLATALLPFPSAVGGTLSSALAAPVTVPFYAIAAYPDNSTSVRGPQGVALAPDGDVIIADTGNHRVRVLSSGGVLKASFGSKGTTTGRLSSPVAAALGPDNLIYVADTGNSRVQVFQRNGTFVRGWGSQGGANGQFSYPEGIAVGTDGRVYVSDSGNARVAVFSATGTFLETWGSRGDSPDQFDRPSGVAVDASGFVYVVDTNKRQVMKFGSTAPRTLVTWGWTDSTPSTPGVSRYMSPTGISLARDGNSLIVADTGNFRIERCTLVGGVLESLGALPDIVTGWSLFNRPGSGALALDGTLIVADAGNDRIQLRSPVGVWATPWSTPSAVSPFLSAPEAVAADLSTGVNYVADTGNSRILKYSVSGDYLGMVAGPGSGAGQVSSPKGLLVLADGTLLVSDTGNNRIQRYDASGTYLGSFGQQAGAGQVSAPRALAVSDAGTLFVADTGKNRVAKFSTATWLYESMIGPGTQGSANGQFNQPRGVAVSGDVLWVADTGNNRVQKFSAAAGTYLIKTGSYGTAVGRMYQPASVMADGTEVVVADTGNNRLVRYADNLTLLSTYDGTNTRVGSMWEPASLAPTQAGRTLALERKGCRVQVLLRDGVAPVTTAASTASGPTRAATVRLTFSATDVGSAVAATYARVDGVVQPVSGPVDLSVEGTHTVAFWSVDLAENLESEQTTQVVIDRTAPVGTMQLAGGSSVTSVTGVAVSSAVSGANQMRIAVDAAPTSAWATYSTAATVTLPATDGTHTVYAEYRDEAGNVRSLQRDIRLDRTGPAVVGLASSTHPSGVPTWGTARVSWDAATDPSGVTGYAISVDSNPAGVPAKTITTSQTTATFPTLATGTWYVHAMARDGLGNWGPVASIAIQGRSDFGAPETTATGVPSKDTSANVTVTLTATDTISGPAGIRYRKDGGVEATYTAPVAFTTEGAHTLSFYALDRAGNLELEQDVTFRIDRTAPVGTMQLAGGSSVTSATAVAVASAVSGANQMRIAVDAAPTSTWVTYSTAATVTLPAVDGTHTVYAEYRDEAGNVRSLQRDIRLDRTGPAVVGLASSTHAFGVPTWGTARVSWDATTDPSGVTGYAVSIDLNPAGVPAKTITTSQTTATFPTLATGTWYVHAMARDELGNWGPVASIAIEGRSDFGAPETTATGVPIGPSPAAVTIALEATDTVSGAQTIYYRRDGGIESVYTTPLVFSAEGAHTLAFRAVDRAGISELEQSIAFIIDYLAPVGTFVVDDDAGRTATTTVSITSAVEGTNQMRFAVDASPISTWDTYSTAATVTLPAVDGTHTVYAEYRDEAGNVLPLQRDIRLDRTGPAVVGLASSSHPSGVPTWGSAELFWDAATDPSGVSGYAVSVDSNPAGVPVKTITSSQTTATFPRLATGTWYVHAMARDELGNWGPVASIAIEGRSDFGAPVTTVTGVPSRETSANVTVTLTATDTISGPAGIRYRKDGGVEAIYTAPVAFTTEGAHTLSFYALDRAGNLELEQDVTFRIDRTAPVGTMQLAGGSSVTPVTAVAISSAVSGANQMRVAVDAAPTSAWVTYSTAATATLPAVDGTHTVYAEYRDEAGNVRSLQRDIRLDRTGPAITGLASFTHAFGVPTWGSAELSWDAATDPSGVTGYAISVDSNPAGVPAKTITTSQTTATFPTLATGTWYVHAMARDGLGNWGPVALIALEGRSDFGVPATTVTGVPSRPTSANVIVTLTATDAISGPAGIRFRKDGGAEMTYAAPIAFTTEGAHTLSFYALDRAGNLEVMQSVAFTIDRTKPRVNRPAYVARPAGDTLSVAWSSAADLSGVVGYAIAFDTSPTTVPAAIVTAQSAQFTFPASSTQRYLHFRAVDAAGNWSDTVHFDTWPKPVRLSRPIIVRPSGTPRTLAFTVTGSIESSAATGVVRVILERRTANGAWTTYRVLNSVPLRSVAGANRATYTSARIAFRTLRYVPRGTEWRARTVWAGNAALRPAGSTYSRAARLR